MVGFILGVIASSFATVVYQTLAQRRRRAARRRKPNLPRTEREYWRTFHLIRGDVQAAVKSFNTYLSVHNLVVAERGIQDKINRFPEYWTLSLFALQTTFFIVFGRLFDDRSDSHSVQKLVEATIAHPEFFSRAALRERRREASKIAGTDPDWLKQFLADAWEPIGADIEPLRAALVPHSQRVAKIYKPLRHKVFAHKAVEDDAAISALFAKTLIGDVMDTLRFLHTLLWAISELAWNATKPDLTNFRDYESYVKDQNAKTERFVRQLP